MDVAVDLYLAVPLLLTVLAVILASLFVKLRSAEGDKVAEAGKGEESQGEEAGAGAAADQGEGGEERKDGEGEGKEGEELKGEGDKRGEKDEEEAKVEGRRIPVEEIGAGEGKTKRAEENEKQQPEAAAAAARSSEAEKQSHPQEMNMPRRAAVEEEEEAEEDEGKEEDQDWENERLVVKEPDVDDAADEQISFKYSPGKLRGNQYKTMMTKEELEEEQRVQREQLAAIFRLMKENSETFGAMSEGDMKEQLKLYDM
ncbi:matrix-remodeling-associated protein 7 isoform X1 [Emydura macquarii macquarii]|uniref:matrix-remodeling-associated protein 7 isoform X1 n=1 Tax=Emydura macquarii macquarii TaxID=1129001 RepID=UPI00352AA894